MKEAIVSAGPKARFVDSPVPTPGPDRVIIKLAVVAANPKDWETASLASTKLASLGGGYDPYALCPAHTTFHILKSLKFEEAVTIPVMAGTAAVGLYERNGGLGPPLPFLPATDPMPLVVYGASCSVGSFAVQLAKKLNVHPLICVAGGGALVIEGMIDGGKPDTIIDYWKGDDIVFKEIKAALDGISLRYAFNTVAHKNTSKTTVEATLQGGQTALTLHPEGGLTNDVEQF